VSLHLCAATLIGFGFPLDLYDRVLHASAIASGFLVVSILHD
jgi:hypothetical protein